MLHNQLMLDAFATLSCNCRRWQTIWNMWHNSL